jgi:hypothetical protein
MSRPSFRPIPSPLDVDDEALGRVADQMGVPTLVRPSPPPPAERPQPIEVAVGSAPGMAAGTEASNAGRHRRPTKQRRTALESLTLELPGYVIDAIKQRALNEHATARYVVMQALQAAGFQIDASHLLPDARRRRPKAGSA